VRRESDGMWMIPIRMEPVEAHIHADRRLAFQVLTAFGTSQPDGSSSRVLLDAGERKLVEFHTLYAVDGEVRKVLRTVEWVTLHEPEAVDFFGVEGPVPFLRDRFLLEDAGGCTRFRYESTFGLNGWLVGWLVGHYRVKPRMSRFMLAHTRGLKTTIEERARRSRLFVYPEACPFTE
jgi:hypothetical protein